MPPKSPFETYDPAKYPKLDAERQSLVLANTGIAYLKLWEVCGMLPRRVVLDTYEPVALLALCEAASRYDPARGTTFATFAGRWVWGCLRTAMTRELRHKTGVVSLDAIRERWPKEYAHAEPAAPEDPDALAAADEAAKAHAALAGLDPRWRRAVWLRYGCGWSFPAVGADLGVTGERARVLVRKALRWARAERGEG